MSAESREIHELDFEAIKKIIPQRFPFLMLDRVVDIEPGVRVVGLKNLSGNEWFYQGHFPNRAITPGVMVCEGVAQTAIVFFHLARPTRNGTMYLLHTLKTRFLSPSFPGDQIHFEVTPVKLLADRAILNAVVTVNSRTIAKCELSLAVK